MLRTSDNRCKHSASAFSLDRELNILSLLLYMLESVAGVLLRVIRTRGKGDRPM